MSTIPALLVQHDLLNVHYSSYLIQGTHQLNLKAFEGSLKYLGESDIDGDEVQCITANLIDKVA